MKQKRIIAVVTAATLMLSGSFAAWATEAEDIEYLTNLESEAEEIAEEAEVEAAKPEETVETLSQSVEEEPPEVEEIEALETDEAEIDDIAEILEEDELAEDLEKEEEDEESEDADEDTLILTPTSEMAVGTFMGMKEIAEYDPNMIEVIKGNEDGIKPFAVSGTTKYTPYSRSYNYISLIFSSCGGHSGDEILEKTVTIISGNEGGYNTVVPDDNGTGAPSIGRLGWWAEGAKTLAELIVSEDNETAYKLLGEDLYNEIIDESITWTKGTRVFNSEEKVLMQNFLDPNNNPASKTVQDKMANSWVAEYLNNGYGLGIRNAAALVYFADINNQYGYTGGSMGAAKACAQYACVIAGNDWSKVTLNELHLASTANVAHNYVGRTSQKSYIERRRYTYGLLVESGWTYCNSGDYTIPYNSDGSNGAAWLQAALNSYTNAGLSVTGVYDDALKAAVKAYQEAVGLTADGLAGLDTSTKLIHDMYYDMMTTGADMGSVDVSNVVSSTGSDIVKINGVWTYTYNGEADYSYTGLAKNSNGWYYIKNGELDRTYTGFAKNENGSWYITEGKLTRKDNSVIQDTKGALGIKDEWYYVVGSKVQYDFTGLANYKSSSGWWYITKGVVDRSYKGLAKNKNGWYYLTNGKVDRSYTGFATNENGSWYMTDGKLTRKDNTVIKDTKGVLGDKNEWYYVVGSKVQYDFTGLANYKNASGWWYITNGKVDRTVNTVAKNKNGWYYVLNGKVQKGFTGLANYKNASGWWYIKNGKVDRTFAGIAQNKNGWYYIKNGKVQHGFSGTVTVDGTTYSVTNGKVAK